MVTGRSTQSLRRLGGRLGATAAVALVTAASACGSTTTTSPPAPATPISVHLAAMPGGVANLSWDKATQRISVAVDMQGFAPNIEVAMRLRPGTCLAPGATALLTFTAIGLAADSGGAIHRSAVSDTAEPAGIPATSIFVIEASGGGALLACTDLKNPGTAPFRVYPPPDAKPVGTATLTFYPSAATLHVQLNAFGLPAGSPLTAELRRGACQSQGPPVKNLVATTADGRGNLISTVQLTHVAAPAGGEYVVILARSNPAPLLCGDVPG